MIDPPEAPAGLAPPAKPRVLLLHGLTGAPGDLQVITRHLQRSGYEVTTPMLPGHGVGEAALVCTGWRDWLAAVEAELLRLATPEAPAFVGGLSMGAILALAIAARHPDRVKGVVCFAPTLRYDGWVVPHGPWLAWLMPLLAWMPVVNRYRFKERPPYGIKDERLRAKMVELLESGAIAEAGLPFMPGRSLAQNLRLIRRVKRWAPRITAPMLLVHALEDDITHVRNADALAARVSGPVSKLYLDDSYHLVTVDRQRGKVARATAEFLDRLSAPSSSFETSPTRPEPA